MKKSLKIDSYEKFSQYYWYTKTPTFQNYCNQQSETSKILLFFDSLESVHEVEDAAAASNKKVRSNKKPQDKSHLLPTLHWKLT